MKGRIREDEVNWPINGAARVGRSFIVRASYCDVRRLLKSQLGCQEELDSMLSVSMALNGIVHVVSAYARLEKAGRVEARE